MSHPVLTAPIGRSLLRLAGPTTAIMLVQMVVAIAETAIVGRLGTEALAGFALVFPFMVLMFTLSIGSMGGAVASALARSLGAGRRDDANAIVFHALLLAIGLGLVCTVAALVGGPYLLRWIGGGEGVLRQATIFGQIWFAGVVLLWANSFLGALLRGSGDALTPARYGLATSCSYIVLAGGLALGIGDWNGLGIAGLAVASLSTSVASILLMARAMRRGCMGFVPTLTGVRLQTRLFREILKVGLISSVSGLTTILTASLLTALVGRFGPAALAGYGIAMRLEYMLGPLAYGIGSGLTTLVGIAAGAGDWQRARRAAWTGGLISGVAIGTLGGAVALIPERWSRLFTSEPDVIAVSVACLSWVGPTYFLLGLGLTLYFASQGAGRMAVPFAASMLRFAITAAGSWLAVDTFGFGLDGLFAVLALGLVCYGGLIAGMLLLRPWQPKPS